MFQVKRSLKSGPLFVPDQFVTMIRTAKKTGNPYQVRELTHEDFVDVKQLAKDYGNPSFNVNTEGEKVCISDMQVIKVVKNEPFKLFYKTSYSDEIFKIIDIKRNSLRNVKKNLQQLNVVPTLNKAYKNKLGINENKAKDLKFLLEKGYIPKYYSTFYNSLF